MNINDLIHTMQLYGLHINANKLVFRNIGRCTTTRKIKDNNGWYIIFQNDAFITAFYGDHQLGESFKWCSKQRLSKQEKLEQRANYLEYQKQMEHEKKIQLQNINQQYAQFKKLDRNKSYSYLLKKGIHSWLRCSQAEQLRSDKFGNIIMPIKNIDDKLYGYQIINSNGDKKFVFGTQKKGNFYLLIADCLKISDCHYLFIGEGLATMISWYLAMNEYLENYHYACVVALDVGNIEPVLLQLWQKFPDKSITIIADNDCNSDKNIGVETCNKIKTKYQNKYKIDVFIPELNHEVAAS
jgi:putative DNA primase/helicase